MPPPLGAKPNAFETAKPVFTAGPEPTWQPPPAVPGRMVWQTGAEPVPGYRLVKMLGRGGFGEVWKAVGPGEIAVALKYLALDSDAASVEARALGLMKEVRHPHLLPLFGAWQTGGHLIMAMELAEGSLQDRFEVARKQGHSGIAPDQLWDWMLEAAKGLDYLNEPHPGAAGEWNIGIQHRDIKPQNLLLVGGSVKVADFGLAKVMAQTVASHTGNMTLPFAAPEFFNGKTAPTSDQYSLAVTYCYLRGGRLPFAGQPTEIMAGHLMNEPDLSMLPDGERAVVARALAKQPNDRWPSCKAFLHAMRNFPLPPTLPRNDVISRTHPQSPPPVLMPLPLPMEDVPADETWRKHKKRCLGIMAGLMAVGLIACGIGNRALGTAPKVVVPTATGTAR
jgi:serine/threonine protein kinase